MPILRVLSVAALVMAALVSPLPARASDLPVVFVSIPPQKFVVEQLAGDLVRVEVMLPSGASPATYEPTPRQMAAINEAVIYFQIGVPFEGPVLAKISKSLIADRALSLPPWRVVTTDMTTAPWTLTSGLTRWP